MTRKAARALFVAFVPLMPASAWPVQRPPERIVVEIREDCRLTWDGRPVGDREFFRRFDRLIRRADAPNVTFRILGVNCPIFEKIAKLSAGNGATHVGFTGVNSNP